LGPVNLPSTVPFHASQMYARTVTNYLAHLLKDGRVQLDLNDELTRGPLVAHQGEVVQVRMKEMGRACTPRRHDMRCAHCGQPTAEFLVTGTREKQFLFFRWRGADSTFLCRDHLIERFRATFRSATQRMIVLYPNLEEKHGNYQYTYMTFDQLKHY